MDNTFLQNKKLLLVDDEPKLLEMVTAILSDEGFGNIVTAVSVKEGISAVQNEKPDLAILDVMLPDGDGFSLMQQIRTFSDMPVIFLTAKERGRRPAVRAWAWGRMTILQSHSCHRNCCSASMPFCAGAIRKIHRL